MTWTSWSECACDGYKKRTRQCKKTMTSDVCFGDDEDEEACTANCDGDSTFSLNKLNFCAYWHSNNKIYF